MKSVIWFLVATIIIFASCARSSAVVTGQVRPATNPDEVRLYVEPPASFKTIAILDARSGFGIGDQAKLDSAIAELKRKAASLGANGLLLSGIGDRVGNAVLVPDGSGGGAIVQSHKKIVTAAAIFVP